MIEMHSFVIQHSAVRVHKSTLRQQCADLFELILKLDKSLFAIVTNGIEYLTS